jgi:probable F420-dependent oxidoreductase
VLAGRLEAGFEGDFYTHKIVTPMFTPEPQPHPFPKVFVAAVGEAMTEMCGEVADGLIAHAFTTKRYFEEVTTPALLRGMQRASRRRSEFQLSCPIFVVTGETEDELVAGAVSTRKQIALYGSTPAYRKVLELHAGGLAHRTAPAEPSGRMGCHGLAHRRRDPRGIRGRRSSRHEREQDP